MRCTRGAIFVVIVDLRPDSTSWRGWLGVELTARNQRLVYVPEGFAQGYQTLEDDTEVLYQMSHHYVPEAATWRALGRPRLRHRVAGGRAAAHLRPRSGVAGLLARGYAVVSRPACSSRSAARRTTG